MCHGKGFSYCITWNKPAKQHSAKSQCFLFILSEQWRTAISRILISDKFRLSTLMEVSCKELLMSTRSSCVLFQSTSTSRISVSVNWYSSSASSTPSVRLNHWWRDPSMTASTRAKPGHKVRPVIQRLMNSHIRTNHDWRRELAGRAVMRGWKTEKRVGEGGWRWKEWKLLIPGSLRWLSVNIHEHVKGRGKIKEDYKHLIKV